MPALQTTNPDRANPAVADATTEVAAVAAQHLSDRDADLARQSGQAIARFAGEDDTLQVTFTNQAGERLEAALPAFAVQILARVLTEVARGTPVTLVPRQAELTTHQAAALLHVSRPFLIKLLDEGKIPHRRVGSHRRIRRDDLRTYLEREKAARRETLRELAAYDQEIGLDDLEGK